MALKFNELENDLIELLNNPTLFKDVSEAAERWQTIISKFFKTASDISGDGFLSSPSEKLFKEQMKLAFIGKDATFFAENLEKACILFWTLATFNIKKPAPGLNAEVTSIVSVPGLPGSLSVPLIAAFSTVTNNVKSRVKLIVAAFQAFTKTVLVIISGTAGAPPVPTVLPPSPIV